jgi:hypothetical protein
VVLFLLTKRRLLGGLVARCLWLGIKFPGERVAGHVLRRRLSDGLVRSRLRYTRVCRGRTEGLLLVVPGRRICTKTSRGSSSAKKSGVAAVMVFIFGVDDSR